MLRHYLKRSLEGEDDLDSPIRILKGSRLVPYRHYASGTNLCLADAPCLSTELFWPEEKVSLRETLPAYL